jgi:hypothetical protein
MSGSLEVKIAQGCLPTSRPWTSRLPDSSSTTKDQKLKNSYPCPSVKSVVQNSPGNKAARVWPFLTTDHTDVHGWDIGS